MKGIMCPHCFQWVEVDVADDDEGIMIMDCDVCCRPIEITVERNGTEQTVHAERSQ